MKVRSRSSARRRWMRKSPRTSIDFLDRNDPKKTNKPFFVWYNPARMHITTVLSPKYWTCSAPRAARIGVSTKPA